jgi:hypothetical protein
LDGGTQLLEHNDVAIFCVQFSHFDLSSLQHLYLGLLDVGWLPTHELELKGYLE